MRSSNVFPRYMPSKIFVFSENANREDKAKIEEQCLHEVLTVIEKRDILLLELEIERKRLVQTITNVSKD